MRNVTDQLRAQAMVVLVFACLAGISTVAAAVAPAIG